MAVYPQESRRHKRAPGRDDSLDVSFIDSASERSPLSEVDEMLRYRHCVLVTVVGAAILGFVIGCPSIDPSLEGGNDSTSGDALPGRSTVSGFVERWESSSLATHSPGGLSTFKGDAGNWFLGDTASNFDNCGSSPHTAEVINYRGSKALRVTSNESPCADNVWVSFSNNPALKNSFEIPISPSTQLSFYEEGVLHEPGPGCGLYQCAISLNVEDSRGNLLVYMLQRDTGRQPPDEFFSLHVFLDPDAGDQRRNLYDDFSQIPRFNPSGAKVRAVTLKVGNHGWAILDDLVIMGGPG